MKRALSFLAASLLFSILGLDMSTALGEPAAPAAPTVVKVGRLFDGTGDAFRTDQVIVIEGDRIKVVGAAAEVDDPRRGRGHRPVRRDRSCPA